MEGEEQESIEWMNYVFETTGVDSNYNIEMKSHDYRKFIFENYTEAYRMTTKKEEGPAYDICFVEQPKFELTIETRHHMFT